MSFLVAAGAAWSLLAFGAEPSLAEAAARATPATVHLRVRKARKFAPELDEVRQSFAIRRASVPDGEVRRETTGSGVVVDETGRVYTNHHVVEGAVQVDATFSNQRRVSAQVLSSDPRSDIALLQLDVAPPVPWLPRGTSDAVRVGEPVIAIGSPFDFSATVSVGVLSARSRRGLAPGEIQDFLQTDAAINPGNSGGPLVDAYGKLIGINTAIYAPAAEQNSGISFAVPIEMADAIAEELRAHGRVRRPWIGVRVGPAPAVEGDPSRSGTEILRVEAYGPAEQAGLRRGDVVVAIDHVPTPSVAAFRSALLSRTLAQPLLLRVFRDQRSFDVPLFGREHGVSEAPPDAASEARRWASALVADATADTTRGLGVASGVGCVVTGGVDGGLPFAFGARPGDRLVTMDGQPVRGLSDLTTADEPARRWHIVGVKRGGVSLHQIWPEISRDQPSAP
jgi:S1-C subfamily serine protease